MIPAVAHIREITNSTHVHQHTGCGKAQLHERQQRHPTSKDLRLVTVLSERSNHLVDRAGAHVLERCRNHSEPPAAITARTMLRYPVHRQRLPSSPSRTCSSEG